jgi:hypothetical protein
MQISLFPGKCPEQHCSQVSAPSMGDRLRVPGVVEPTFTEPTFPGKNSKCAFCKLLE